MAACQQKAVMYRKPRALEVMRRIESGEDGSEYRPVLAVHYCSLTARHRGDHDFKTQRWIMWRGIARVTVALVIVAAVVIVGSLDTPNLH